MKMCDVPITIEQSLLKINLSMRIDDKNKKDGIIILYLRFFYNYASKDILNYEGGFHFKISGEGDKKDISKVLPILFSISYSTLRGMVAVRSLGTSLENYPVPLIDLNKIFKKKQKPTE